MNAVRRRVLIFWARQPKPLSLSERQHAPESVFGRLSTKAARATGLSQQGVCNAVARVRRADDILSQSVIRTPTT
jgi:hypothetical protein